MEPQQEESNLEESVKQVMQTLPPPVREYLTKGKYSIAAKDLTAEHDLHIDQGAVLEREIMLLLMGIENPDECMKALTNEATIPEQVVQDIMTEINQQIFLPLQEEMRKGTEMFKHSAAASAPPRGGSQMFTSRPIQANPQMPRYQSDNEITSVPANAAKDAASPFITVVPRPSPKAIESVAEPIVDEKFLEDHEEPHIEINGINKIPLPISPRTAPPPPNLPGVIAAPKINQPPPVPSKPYTVDPYREPIDEK